MAPCKRLLWDKFSRMSKTYFPATLLKKVRRGIRGQKKWITGIKGYQYYPTDEVQQWILSRRSFRTKRHLVLPIPEDQGRRSTCLVHAIINATEARFRIAQWSLDPRIDIPRLSIQHAIDAIAPFRNEDTVFNLLGVRYVNECIGLGMDEIGVTTAAAWPYRALGERDRPVLPLPREVPEWERFKLRHVETINESSYDGDSEAVINDLIAKLRKDGPFVAWFTIRSTHTALGICRKTGHSLRVRHSVVISGYKKWRSSRSNRMCGYWEFLDTYGIDYGRNGFGRIAFNAVSGVEIPYPLI